MKRCLTAIILGLAATSALAADDKTGWNAGIAASFADYSFDSNQLDDSSTGFKLFTGYRFNQLLGVEGAYHNFGDFDEDLDPPNPGGDAKAQIDGFSLSAMLFAPLDSEEFEAYGKAGYYFFDQQVVVDDAVAASNSPDGLLLGAGVRLLISKEFAIRAEGDWFNISDGSLWALNVGFEYLFGRPAKPVVPVAAAAAPVVAAPPPPPPPPPPADTDGDGVIDTNDQCPDTPKGERVGPQGCSCDVTRQVQFKVDSAELTSEGMADLDEVAENLKRLNFVSGTVVGHTDSSGSDAYNQQLSERRAQSVADYLEGKGIAAGRLKASGAGESQPVADNSTPEGRAQNRRVVLQRTDCEQAN
jgi:outer membrane protein OmpA-like peptidoglycan-associated protein/opacity protein-like surface antigen